MFQRIGMVSLPLGALVVSFVTHYLLIRIAKRKALFIDTAANQKPQRLHTVDTPRAGGVGIFIGLSMALTLPMGMHTFVPLTLAFVSGLIEDWQLNVSPLIRLGLQTVAALTGVLLADAVVTYLGLGISLPYIVGVAFSIFAIVGLMNAINFIDGLHGLAGGVALLILSAYGIVAMHVGCTQLYDFITIVAGAVIGFMLLNFPSGRIFLGDGGAYLVGFLLALIGIYLAGHYDKVSPWFVLQVLIYPVWEVLFSIYRRLRDHRPVLAPDDRHLHTLLYRYVGHNAATTLILVAAYAPFVLIPTLYANHSAGNILTTLCFIAAYLTSYRYLEKHVA